MFTLLIPFIIWHSSRCKETTAHGKYKNGNNCWPSETLLFLLLLLRFPLLAVVVVVVILSTTWIRIVGVVIPVIVIVVGVVIALLLARRYTSTELLKTFPSSRKIVIAIFKFIPARLMITLILTLIFARRGQSFASGCIRLTALKTHLGTSWRQGRRCQGWTMTVSAIWSCPRGGGGGGSICCVRCGWRCVGGIIGASWQRVSIWGRMMLQQVWRLLWITMAVVHRGRWLRRHRLPWHWLWRRRRRIWLPEEVVLVSGGKADAGARSAGWHMISMSKKYIRACITGRLGNRARGTRWCRVLEDLRGCSIIHIIVVAMKMLLIPFTECG